MSVGSEPAPADSRQREGDLYDLEGLGSQNPSRADIAELIGSMLTARIVRLEGEVFALRQQLAQVRRSQSNHAGDRSTEPQAK